MSKNIVIACLFLLICSCQKKSDNIIDISGVVSDKLSPLPIGQVDVLLEIKPFGGATFSNSFEELEVTQTNLSGEYNLSFQNSNAVEYRITYSKLGCFSEQELINPDQLSLEDINFINATMYSSSYLVLNVVNSSPYNNNDELVLNTSLESSSIGSCFNTIVTLLGTNVDTTIACQIYGNQTVDFEYIVTKDNFTTAYSDAVYCEPGDTIYKVINY